VTLGVQLSKKKGCRTEIESPIREGGVNLKTRGAISSVNIFFQKYIMELEKEGCKHENWGCI